MSDVFVLMSFHFFKFRYTAFSELLPLLALGTVPFLKVEKIRQDIDVPSQTIVNSVTISSPFASFSFSASASFEVRSPTRIQVTHYFTHMFRCHYLSNSRSVFSILDILAHKDSSGSLICYSCAEVNT